MANVAPKAFLVKQEALDKEDFLVSFSHFLSSTFINLNDSFDEDVHLPMNSDMNVYGSFPTSVLDVYLVDVLSNLNQVQGRSFEIVINCLTTMSVAPHSSNELRSLDYNKIKIQYVFSLSITFNDDIIFELPPIRLPTDHFGQMQGMDCKYNGYAWCKVKTSNINNNFDLGFRSTKCLGHLHCDNDSCEHFL